MTRRHCLLQFAPRPRKPLRGVFPIAQTPFTRNNELDLDTLARQLRFLHQTKVPGVVWPQLASEWSTLREGERKEGAETLLKTGRDLAPAVVIGVQAGDARTAIRYAEHATEHGADALIALPPPGVTDADALLAYYQTIGQASPLPLFIQAIGNLSVETIARMARAIPTLRFVKDEAGEPLTRLAPLRQAQLEVFTGAHGRTMIDEMIRGSAGTMPAASFADLYVQVWNDWQSGQRSRSLDTFGVIMTIVTEVQVYGIAALKYILELRGVFPNHRTRQTDKVPLDAPARQLLETLVAHAKPRFVKAECCSPSRPAAGARN